MLRLAQPAANHHHVRIEQVDEAGHGTSQGAADGLDAFDGGYVFLPDGVQDIFQA